MARHFLVFWKIRLTFVFWANSSIGMQSCPTPPGRCAGRPDLTCPWYVRFFGSTGLNRVSLVLASRGTPRRSFFHRLEGKRVCFSWGKSPIVGVLCCPSLPGPADPPCAAPYRPAWGLPRFWTRQVKLHVLPQALRNEKIFCLR